MEAQNTQKSTPSIYKKKEISKDQWKLSSDSHPPSTNTKLSHILLEYLINAGHYQTAKTLANEKNLKFEDTKYTSLREKITKAVLKGDTESVENMLTTPEISKFYCKDNILFALKIHNLHEMIDKIHQSDLLYNQKSEINSLIEYINNSVEIYMNMGVDSIQENKKQLVEALSFLIFKTGDSILERRKKLARKINQSILSALNYENDSINAAVENLISLEEHLAEKHIFPAFKDTLFK
ncbi:hypothetical protein EDEG_02011 [Edhazardia aedis USNM 41457]|uniref:LisH domain-containing protein n=1 Tax=Edhazardia aedis (strain USNM 41457) TaxID=1003232 RepID=J9DQR6_EDHAE|nr:hypothetical protein EDEG_02011 [Edhazardia aedis USNM 41457]|eukprot:EJW03662.1 hypothetical protein EDEG_02011 [Edhazardia aedis USNM 41457]